MKIIPFDKSAELLALTREQIEHLHSTLKEGDVETAVEWLEMVLRFGEVEAE